MHMCKEMAVDSPGSWVSDIDSASIIPRGDWLAGVCDPGRLDSPGYTTPGRFYEKFGPMTPRGLIPRGVIFWRIFYWLAGVSYCAELISPGYNTPASHLLKFVLKSPWGMILIPRQVNLPGYHTAQSQSPRGIKPRGVNKNPPNMTPRGMRPRGVSARSSQ